MLHVRMGLSSMNLPGKAERAGQRPVDAMPTAAARISLERHRMAWMTLLHVRMRLSWINLPGIAVRAREQGLADAMPTAARQLQPRSARSSVGWPGWLASLDPSWVPGLAQLLTGCRCLAALQIHQGTALLALQSTCVVSTRGSLEACSAVGYAQSQVPHVWT